MNLVPERSVKSSSLTESALAEVVNIGALVSQLPRVTHRLCAP